MSPFLQGLAEGGALFLIFEVAADWGEKDAPRPELSDEEREEAALRRMDVIESLRGFRRLPREQFDPDAEATLYARSVISIDQRSDTIRFTLAGAIAAFVVLILWPLIARLWRVIARFLGSEEAAS